uniref:Jacalin-type lectin domain-containing protein n=1 Tax=Spermophilus dauricus TaxID=99837 RepID=A0A8C9UP20_SPEDA
ILLRMTSGTLPSSCSHLIQEEMEPWGGWVMDSRSQAPQLLGPRVSGSRVQEGAGPRGPGSTGCLGLGLSPSIQLQLGDFWDAVQGIPGGTSQELILGPNEYITEIHGTFLLNLKHLIVCTSRPRCASFGKTVGQAFSAFPKEEGEVLKGICGVHGVFGIRGISLQWGQPPTTSDTQGSDYSDQIPADTQSQSESKK